MEVFVLIIIFLLFLNTKFKRRYKPIYNKKICKKLNNNKPTFTKEEITTESFEFYSDLDYLGRCGVAVSCIGQDLMPTEKRRGISSVKPTGWQSCKYRRIKDGSLYNRCHLIGFQLTAENANRQNLITGTRYFNVDGMLPFENVVGSYVRRTNNHVMYRVAPDFKGSELVARGVQIEALSVEDHGKGIKFNVYIKNEQPGIGIDYRNGFNWRINRKGKEKKGKYVINIHTMKIHTRFCCGADMKYKTNRRYKGYKSDLLYSGYKICKNCNPE